MRVRPALLASTVVLSASLLAGCGVSDAAFEPGVAAQVGDRSVSLASVDDAVGATCTALQANPQSLATGYSGAQLRQIVLAQLVLRQLGDELARENGLDADRLYSQAETTARNNLTAVPDDVADAALPVFAGGAYINLVIDQVVTATLGTSANQQVRQAAGQQVLANVEKQVGVETNPLFAPLDFTVQSGSGPRADLSVAVSPIAEAADAASPAADQVQALPANQRCTAPTS